MSSALPKVNPTEDRQVSNKQHSVDDKRQHRDDVSKLISPEEWQKLPLEERLARNLGEDYKQKANGTAPRIIPYSHSLGSQGMRNDPKRSIRAISFSGRAKPGPREWVVEAHAPEGHASSWYGEGGIAKSLLATHLSLCIAAPSLDYWVGFRLKTMPVVYMDFELDADEKHRRALELSWGMGLEDVPKDFHYLGAAGYSPDDAFGAARAECVRLGAGIAVVDSVGFALEGDSESARDVLTFYRKYINPLTNEGIALLLIDHQAKIIKGEKYSDKQAFGSIYKTNAVRSSFQIRGSQDGPNALVATFSHRKSNLGPKVEDFSVKLLFEKDCVKVRRLEEAASNPDREPTVKERTLKAVRQMARPTAETVSSATDIRLKSVQNAFSKLIAEGELQDTGEKDGNFRIVIPHSRPTKGTGTGNDGTHSDEYDRLVAERQAVLKAKL